ncbi:MAG: TMEM199/VMA12 family vacuolar ATPase assembly factor [Acidobacteria bacterium]|nr:TMEM199/VMA12 family vacuolar ATPase assembly factor [Acidobacteriota bacterium]
MESVLRFLLVFVVAYCVFIWLTWSFHLSLFLALLAGVIAFLGSEKTVYAMLRLTKYAR